MTAVPQTVVSSNEDEGPSKRVVYLLGAGATHGCARFRGSTRSLVMPGLVDQLAERMRQLYYEAYEDHDGIRRLVNEVVEEDTDFEQLITFLEEARSAEYQALAAQLKDIFSSVLRARLDEVRDELGERHSDLYAALLDMHEVGGIGEALRGFLTINYDVFLEHAVEEHLGYTVDFGVAVSPSESDTGQSIRVLKMHGSFGWTDDWPIEVTADHAAGLWIPPGIRKAKTEYPFNAIWGLARELLDCDVLRIVGCNLGPNDWDLVSLLFTTMHTHTSAAPYEIEIIARPETARKISELFPYLSVKSLLEIPKLGDQVVAEVLGGTPRAYAGLTEDEQIQATRNAQHKIENAFEYWLRLKGELMSRDLGTIETSKGVFEQFVEAGR